MARFFRELWKDDRGAIVSIEVLFLFVVFVLGLIAGWTNLRAAVNSEMTEMANSMMSLDQSYSITDVIGCSPLNVVSGSRAIDDDAVIDWVQMGSGDFSFIGVDVCP